MGESERVTISLVIPTLGRAGPLADTLVSVREGSRLPEEIIVIDGDPGGSARPLVESFAQSVTARVVYLTSPPGSTTQRNAGIRAATGDVLVFCDDDVELEPDALDHLADAYADTSVVGAHGRVLEGDARRLAGHASPLQRLIPWRTPEGRFTKVGFPRRIIHAERSIDTEYMHGCFMSARRTDALMTMFDEALSGYALAEDEDFSYRLSRRGRIRYRADARLLHKNLGFTNLNPKQFARKLVINRWYIYRKNFRRGRLDDLSFAFLLLALFAHRCLRLDLRGATGIVEGIGAGLRFRPAGDSQDPRVAFVGSHAASGGAERFLETLLEKVPATMRAGVIVLQHGPAVDRLEATQPVRVLETGASGLSVLVSAFRLRRELRRMRAAVVHANGTKAAVVSTLATIGSGIDVVWIKHDFSHPGVVTKILARRAAAIVGVSAAVLEEVRSGRAGGALIVHPWLVGPLGNPERGRGELLRALGAEEPVEIVGLVGRLDPFKGHAQMIEATSALRDQRPQLRVVFVGGDDPAHAGLRGGLEERIRDAGLERVIVFLGHRLDAQDLIAGLDLLVVPSVPDASGLGREGFGLVPLEAMASGIPVVAANSGALPELIGEAGLLVPPGDAAKLTLAIREVLDDHGLRQRLGSAGVKRAAAFDLDTSVSMLMNVYRRVAG